MMDGASATAPGESNLARSGRLELPTF